LLDHSRMSVSRSHSQVPVCASCSARSSAAGPGRSGSVPDLSARRPAPGLCRGRRCDRCLVVCFGRMRTSCFVTAAEPLHLSARHEGRPIVRPGRDGERSPVTERAGSSSNPRKRRSTSGSGGLGALSRAQQPARDAPPTTPACAGAAPPPPAGPPRIHRGPRRAAGCGHGSDSCRFGTGKNGRPRAQCFRLPAPPLPQRCRGGSPLPKRRVLTPRTQATTSTVAPAALGAVLWRSARSCPLRCDWLAFPLGLAL
jgi:hypothetical protein